MIVQYPTEFSQWLYALDYALYPVREVAIIGDSYDKRTQLLKQAVWSKYRPDVIMASSEFPPPAGSPFLLENRPQFNGLPTAFVCEGFVCQHPVNDVELLTNQLDTLPE